MMKKVMLMRNFQTHAWHSNEISIVDERKVNSNEALIVHLNLNSI
jgi:hypothetical protein